MLYLNQKKMSMRFIAFVAFFRKLYCFFLFLTRKGCFMKKIGIVGAMESEISYLRSKMSEVSVTDIQNLSFYEGFINDIPVVLVKSGIGKVNAALGVQLLILKFNATCVINTGIAGAIAKGLNIFDMVVSTETVYHDVDVTAFDYPPCTLPGTTTYFTADAELRSLAKKAYEPKILLEGRIASGDVFVNTPEKKQKIAQLCSPLCVEMEGAAIAHTCSLYNIPFVIIRCISDSSSDLKATDYKFNETEAAEICSTIVYKMLNLMR